MSGLRVIAALLVAVFLAACSAGERAEVVDESGIVFFEGSFDAALEKAGAEDKLVFVDVYTSWCGPCKLMDLNVFPRADVGAYYNEHFVNFKLDAEDFSIRGPELTNIYGVSAYPSYLYIKPDGTLQYSVGGTFKPELFIAVAREAMGEERQVFAALEKKYDTGDRDRDLVKDYLVEGRYVLTTESFSGESVTAAFMQPEYMARRAALTAAFNEYVDSVEPESLINAEDFDLFSSFLSSVPRENEWIEFVVQHYDAYAQVVEESRIAFLVLESIKVSVALSSRQGDADYTRYIDQLDGELARAYEIQITEIENDYLYKSYLEKLGRNSYLAATKAWDVMLAETDEKIAAAGDTLTGSDYTSFAMHLSMADTPEIQQRALELSAKAYSMEPTAKIASTYMGILGRLGETDRAVEVGEEVLSRDDTRGTDPTFERSIVRMLEIFKSGPAESG